MSKNIICSNCGNENVDMSVFCSNCGAKLEEIASKTETDGSEGTFSSFRSFISKTPYGTFLIAATFLSLMNALAGFMYWINSSFSVFAYLIYGITFIALTGGFCLYLLYCIVSRNYLIQSMGVKDSFSSFKDLSKKNFSILFNRKLFSDTIRRNVLIVLAFLMLAALVIIIVIAIVLYVIYVIENEWW